MISFNLIILIWFAAGGFAWVAHDHWLRSTGRIKTLGRFKAVYRVLTLLVMVLIGPVSIAVVLWLHHEVETNT